MDSDEWERVVLRQQSQKATAEARAVLDRLKNEEPRLVADISARREHRMFVEPEIPQPEPVLNNGQRRTMESHQLQRPPLDPATMAMWNAWFDQRCEALIAKRLKAVVSAIAAKANSNTAIVAKNTKAIDADILKLRSDQVELRKEVAGLIRKLRSDNSRLRAEMKLQSGIASGHVSQLPAFLKGNSNGGK
jgi:hypothetical protein